MTALYFVSKKMLMSFAFNVTVIFLAYIDIVSNIQFTIKLSNILLYYIKDN